MTPQEAEEQSIHEKVRNDDACMFASEDDLLFYDHFFRNGMQYQSEQDNQALSSALKEIAELHAKIKELESRHVILKEGTDQDISVALKEIVERNVKQKSPG